MSDRDGVVQRVPVGTVARRPDGKVLAVRVRVDEGFWRRDIWHYLAPQDPEFLADEPIDDYDADSWPVIYCGGSES